MRQSGFEPEYFGNFGCLRTWQASAISNLRVLDQAGPLAHAINYWVN